MNFNENIKNDSKIVKKNPYLDFFQVQTIIVTLCY